MNSFLPNLRWLCLPSENLGQDWFEKSLEIDLVLPEEKLDLAEEAVFLLYDDVPASLMVGQGNCLVARPVIGPKKSYIAPLLLKDWTAANVWRETVSGSTLTDILLSSERVREKVVKQHPKISRGFLLNIKRRFHTQLLLTVEVIFYE